MDRTQIKVDRSIEDYYTRMPEEERLQQGPFLLEALRTKELIERHISPAPATVLDVGGAAGAYALWLAEKGCTVHLIDPISRLVEEGKRRSAASSHPLASCQVGDARQLCFADACADVVLMLGPLYHLTAADDRARALSEASRVLKPGGMLFAAAISRWGSILDGLARELLADPEFGQIVERDLTTGQHRNETGKPDYFTTAYFHRPEELRAEVTGAGLEAIEVYGIEGPGWILGDVVERLAAGERRKILLRAAQLVESDPAMIGSSAHLLAVGRKPH